MIPDQAPKKLTRVTQAFLGMKKWDVSALQRVDEGESLRQAKSRVNDSMKQTALRL